MASPPRAFGAMLSDPSQPMPNICHKEIERKFLLPKAPEGLDLFPHSRIAQGYIADTPNIVRLRSHDGRTFLLTVKHGREIVRDEGEIDLTREQFDALWPFTAGRRLQKTRYKVPLGSHTIDLDIFEGVHSGLILAEVEFADESECHAFSPPDWFGAEVTSDPRFANHTLAVE